MKKESKDFKTVIYDDNKLVQYVNREENYANTKDYQINDLLKELYSTQKTEVQNGEYRDLHSNIRPYVGYLVARIIKDNNFSKILEIGTGYGVSSIYMLHGLEDSKSEDNKVLVSIDPYQSSNIPTPKSTPWENGGLINIYKSGYSKYLDFYELTSYEALPLFYRESRVFDVVFIHGNNLFDYKMFDIFYTNKLTKVGSVIFLSDEGYNSDIQVREYIETNYKNWKKIKNNFVNNSFFSLYIKISEDTRDKDFHKDF